MDKLISFNPTDKELKNLECKFLWEAMYKEILERIVNAVAEGDAPDLEDLFINDRDSREFGMEMYLETDVQLNAAKYFRNIGQDDDPLKEEVLDLMIARVRGNFEKLAGFTIEWGEF